MIFLVFIVCMFLVQSVVLESEIHKQTQDIASSTHQLQLARAKLERTHNSLTEQIETLEVSTYYIVSQYLKCQLLIHEQRTQSILYANTGQAQYILFLSLTYIPSRHS